MTTLKEMLILSDYTLLMWMFLVATANYLIMEMVMHRVRVTLNRRASRRRHPSNPEWRRAVWSSCNAVVATGIVEGHRHTANCALPAGHTGACAAPLGALEFLGFTQPIF